MLSPGGAEPRGKVWLGDAEPWGVLNPGDAGLGGAEPQGC